MKCVDRRVQRAPAYMCSLHSLFPLFLWGNARLHSHLDKRPHPTPQPGIQKLSTPTTYAI